MKNAVKEFIELTNDEKQELWEKAVFIFDTNVLLNLYRYSQGTRDSLLKAFESLKSRVWIPHQIAYEYMKNRCEVIYESVQQYDALKSKGEAFTRDIKEALRLNSEDKDLAELDKYLCDWLEKNKNRHLLVTNPSKDEILDRILKLFDEKVGEEVSGEELEALKREGAERYKKNIPPGYKDAAKQKEQSDNNAYGDLIIWKQIMKYAVESDKDIIFVTHDQKEDWWYKTKGKTIGPRFELKKEFHKETKRMFHMYRMDSFINEYNRLNLEKIEKSAVDEVITLDNEMYFNTLISSGRKYYENLKKKEDLDLIRQRLATYRGKKHMLESAMKNMNGKELNNAKEEHENLVKIIMELQAVYFSIKKNLYETEREYPVIGNSIEINEVMDRQYYKKNE